MVDEDTALLERWRAGDRGAGDALFSRHFDSVYGFFVRKIGGDVSDLAQRTFMGLVEAKDRFRGDSSVRTYLFAIARNELMRYFRERRKDMQLSFDVNSLHDLEPTPSAEVQKGRENRLLLEALRHIPLDMQIAVELHYWEGLSGPDIARVLEIPEGTVRSRLRRALEQLRAECERLGRDRIDLQSTLTDLERWASDLATIRGEA